MANSSSLERVVYLVVALFCFTFVKVAALTCYQCKNYGNFFVSQELNALDCTNSSNYVEVTCDSASHFCIKLQGTLLTSALNVLERGCAPPAMSI
ncbi:hypothetical protein BV898_06179 [Hypsibius exemplaris]|uniref:UPAR/Ly6 domain-containing protein n=1 Tax=Hypsibius exemplaris TaxID=2072580 RepID=A0A1W0WXG9_HYPEX|nr:hypothetical protein BV898_06179 [Hypsibius exemplaris]